MRQTPCMKPRKKELKLYCITASNQEPLRLPKLLLLSWHPQEAGHMGCYREARVMTSCCGSLVKLKDIAQNSLCYVFLVGRLGKRSGAGTTKKLWIWGTWDLEPAVPYPPLWAAWPALQLLQLPMDPPLTSPLPGPRVHLAQQGRVSYWRGPYYQGQRQGEQGEQELGWISVAVLTCEFHLVLAVSHFMSIFPSQETAYPAHTVA